MSQQNLDFEAKFGFIKLTTITKKKYNKSNLKNFINAVHSLNSMTINYA